MAEKYARLVMPVQRINPKIRVRAYQNLEHPEMDEKIAYLRGLLNGPNPFEEVPKEPDLAMPWNIGLLREALAKRRLASVK